MKIQLKNIASSLAIVVLVATFSSCTTYNHTMREPNTRVNLTKADFILSEQVMAQAKSVKILGIDWSRLFTNRMGTVINDGSNSVSFASIPVIGSFISDRTVNYSLYNLMYNNPGYDVVFYPQYEIKAFRPILGLGFLTKITTVRTKARLGKLKDSEDSEDSE